MSINKKNKMSINELLGMAKTQSDMTVSPMKLRWDSSPTISPKQIITLNFNRYDDKFLDARSIKACFYLQGLSSDVNAYVDGPVQIVFDKIRLLSGTREIMNVMEAGLLFTQLRDVNQDFNTNLCKNFVEGDDTIANRKTWFALGAPGRQYECNVAPRGSFLNSDILIPCSRMGQLQLELTFAPATKVLVSTADANASYVISSFELHMDYIQSNTIASYFNASPLRVSVTDYSWSGNSFLSAVNGLLRIPSNSKSLQKVLTILRDASSSQSLATAGKNRVAISGSYIMSYNLRVNQQYLYSQSIDCWGKGAVEAWEEFKDAFPNVVKSAYYDSTFVTGPQNRICVNFEASPVKFREQLISGANTSGINDLLLEILFTTAISCKVDSFLFSDCTISLPGGRGDLMIER